MPLQPNTFAINGDFKLDIASGAHPGEAVANIPNDAANNVIRENQPYHVHVQLDLSGPLAVLHGHEITYDVRLESMGSGFEGSVATKEVTYGPMPAPSYSFDEWLECGTPDSDGVGVGVYKLMVIATIKNAGGVPLGIVGFGEGPFIQVYEA